MMKKKSPVGPAPPRPVSPRPGGMNPRSVARQRTTGKQKK